MRLKIGILILACALLACALIPADRGPAVDFINSLNPDQRERVVLAFDDTTKTRWHYLPNGMFPRPGMELGELSESQQERVFTLLRAYLSEAGYDKTRKIINLEPILREMTGDSVMRDPGRFSVVFYGDPSTDSLWAWSFEGHHISLNFTISNGELSTTPRFFGANPATIPIGPRKGERTLATEEDLGFELIRSMSQDQRQLAVLSPKSPFDIESANMPEVDPLEPAGISYDQMTPRQQDLVQQLLAEYLSALPESQVLERMEAIRSEDMGGLLFAWAGGTEQGIGHYYRIQGQSFLIEFDNTQTQANHIHSVWRDFDGDFGKDLIREHYQHAEHHRK